MSTPTLTPAMARHLTPTQLEAMRQVATRRLHSDQAGAATAARARIVVIDAELAHR